MCGKPVLHQSYSIKEGRKEVGKNKDRGYHDESREEENFSGHLFNSQCQRGEISQ